MSDKKVMKLVSEYVENFVIYVCKKQRLLVELEGLLTDG